MGVICLYTMTSRVYHKKTLKNFNFFKTLCTKKDLRLEYFIVMQKCGG